MIGSRAQTSRKASILIENALIVWQCEVKISLLVSARFRIKMANISNFDYFGLIQKIDHM